MSRLFEAIFISDLHLHPDDTTLTSRFFKLLAWANDHTDTLYILGDFLHVWPGDDALEAWSEEIAARIKALSTHDVKCYFMKGNRDFLLGQRFAELSGWTVLSDPSCIQLGETQLLLSHGDRYCTDDKAHQVLRTITRNRGFEGLFMRLPLSWRQRVVKEARHYSRDSNKQKSSAKMDVVVPGVVAELKRFGATMLIHGHTHKPQQVIYRRPQQAYTRWVLSDWDETPVLLCYDKSSGFKFNLLNDLIEE